VILAVPALALAGKTVTEGKNTLRVKATVDPAVASKSKDRPRPVAGTFDAWVGTADGSRLAELRSTKIYLGGARFGFDAFPKCDETDLGHDGRRVCPKGSRVGSGTAIVEFHPPESTTSKEDVELDVTVYNGKLDTNRRGFPMKPRSGLILFTQYAGARIAAPFWAERRNRQLSLYNPRNDPFPESDSVYEIKEVHLTYPRQTVRRDGRRIPFIAAPTDCDRRWTMTVTNEFYEGDPVTAKHSVRCTDA
jgi:hypothetical protein